MHHIYGNNASTDFRISAMTIRAEIFIEMHTFPEFIYLSGMAMITGNIYVLILRKCGRQKEKDDQCQDYYPAAPYYFEIWFY